MPDAPLPAVIDSKQVTIIDRETGESTEVALPDVGIDTIASWVEQLREMKSSCDTAMAALSAEAVRRFDANGAKGQLAGEQRFIRVTGPALTPRWDPARLHLVLGRLVHEGVLEQDAIRGVVTSERVWKVDTAAMKRLAKIPAVAKAIADVALPGEPPQRRITTVGWLQ